ncbi:CatB-related O-acetyltransferase [Thiomicrorhabdus cannonii]|uniref:CatB-related O-acetyltransferase n=1 Tax=Thiomicrorhabdus cannonii TaxID=2748011 RepID=UPI0015BDE400|nr:CatB-related O-acetyltransferase [Thiomicrorhabdus cannonii]
MQIIKKIFCKTDHSLERDRKKTRDRHIRFKGGKPTEVKIGDHSYINGLTIYSWGNHSKVVIGKYCSIADEVTIIAGGEHRKERVSTFPFADRWCLNSLSQSETLAKGDVLIGHDVWIGHGATLLSGITIGHGAIIGAKAVVAKDVAPYAIVVGNPAKVINFRFSEEIIAAMLEINWWDWSEENIEASQSFFENPQYFIKAFWQGRFN